jgi:hypothetical protein
MNIKQKNKTKFLLIFSLIQRDQQGLKLLAANDSKIFPKYEIFLLALDFEV